MTLAHTYHIPQGAGILTTLNSIKGMNLPNLITLLRIALVVPFLWLLLCSSPLGALMVFGCAAALDWVDGYLARKLEQQTTLGAMLDHTADKLLVCSAMLGMLYCYPSIMAFVATLVVVGRDLLMGGLREFWLRNNTPERSSVNLFGKWKTTVQMCAICLVLLAHWQDSSSMMLLTQAAYLLVIAVTLLSLLSYLRPRGNVA